jgi:hypothetical protein
MLAGLSFVQGVDGGEHQYVSQSVDVLCRGSVGEWHEKCHFAGRRQVA